MRGICIIITFSLGAVLVSHAQTDSTREKKISFAAIPIINYSPSFGVMVGTVAQIFYKVHPIDTISPSSSTGVFGMYTSNKTYFVAAFQRLYLKSDSWRLLMAGGAGNLNFQYWQEFPGMEGEYIGYATSANFAVVRADRKIYRKLYGGITTIYSETETEFDISEDFPDSVRSHTLNMNNIGYQFHYDKRDHQVNPYEGFNIEYKNSFYRSWLNSGNDFNKYELTYNHYYQLGNERNIIATRVKASISSGDVPFEGQNVIGGDDIRGYSEGKYRDDQLYAFQAEYRWRFHERVGMVGFLGIATVTSSISEIFKNEWLAGVGAGLRYMMIPKERINIGVDGAIGKDDWGIYFRIGESFGR